MARKSVKGYAEKNYYDVTRFSGGIIATNDPLNEGYFKHLVNFDISDMGQSITPRKGFLTTTCKDDKNNIITFNSNTIYYYDASIGKWVFMDFSDFVHTEYKSKIMYEYYNGVVEWSMRYSENDDEGLLLAGNKPNYIVDKSDNIFIKKPTNQLYVTLNESDYITYEFFFNKKNTEFSLTINYLNNSPKVRLSFDRGKSWVENYDLFTNRIFTTTEGCVRIELSAYRDPEGFVQTSDITYIAIQANDTRIGYAYPEAEIKYYPKTYLVDFNLENKYITDIVPIDTVENLVINGEDFTEYKIDRNDAQLMIDEYGNNTYVCKVYKNDEAIWLTLNYRKNQFTYEGVTYDGNTLVIGQLDTEDVVDFVDISKRNLASNQSIIPDPIQQVYTIEDMPKGFIQKFPMIYIQNEDGKYLINTTNGIEGLTIIPSFFISEIEDNESEEGNTKYKWVYAYDITSTDSMLEFITDESLKQEYIYRSPVYTLDNELVIGYIINTEKLPSEIYNIKVNELQSIPIDDEGTCTKESRTYFKENNNLINYIKSIDTLSEESLRNLELNPDYSYILYIVPKIDTKEVPKTPIMLPYEMFHSASNEKLKMLRSMWYSNYDYAFFEKDNDEFVTHPSMWTTNVQSYFRAIYPEYSKTDFSVVSPKLDGEEATVAYALIRRERSIFTYTDADSKEYLIDDNTIKLIERNINNILINNNYISSDLNELDLIFEDLDSDDFRFYLVPMNNLQEYTNSNPIGYSGISQTTLHSDIIAFRDDEELDYTELKDKLNNIKDLRGLYINILCRGAKVRFTNNSNKDRNKIENIESLDKLFPQVFVDDVSNYRVYIRSNKYEDHKNFPVRPEDVNEGNYIDKLSTQLDLHVRNNDSEHSSILGIATDLNSDAVRSDTLVNLFDILAKSSVPDINSSNIGKINFKSSDITTFIPKLKKYTSSTIPNLFSLRVGENSWQDENIFKKESGIIKAHLTTENKDTDTAAWRFDYLKNKGFFDQGLNITMYIMKIPTREWLIEKDVKSIRYSRDYFINTTSLFNSRLIVKDTITPSTYIEKLTEEPEMIASAKDYFIFHSSLGDHLVTWRHNRIFISKENKQYYFTEDNSFTYPESIVKAIQYKDTVLVFTTQNLYAIYLTEYVTNVANGTNEDGSTNYVQQTTYVFASLPVLYNLMVDERYKDAIQVYNQMILFYSADGQMFLIKPTAAIDSDTRFSIQYFNKSANDILLNYKEYMQERLSIYGVDKVIDDVEIKVSASINYIKIFYTAKDIMTYVLVYDILNNRYYVYDTLIFTKINSLQYIPSGELYIVEDSDKLYFTLPYTQPNEVNNNVDITYKDYFCNYPIYSELDTGTINLNNHLKKRFKDIHVIYKNLNATDIGFSLETFVDDVPIITYIESNLEVRDIAGSKTLVSVESNKVTNFLENNTALFNFIDYTSNKIITHKTNIVSRGKAIRTKLHFTSKGRYKIQGFGIIYKEHTV